MIRHHSRRTKCELVKTKKLGDATVTNQCHWNNDFGSVGRRSGGTIAQGTGETVNVAAGTGYIKANDVDTDDLLAFDWEASNGISIPTNSTRFIGVKYNGGTPIVDSRISQNWDLDTEFPLGSVINLNGTLYILNNPWWVTDGITNLIEKSVGLGGYLARDNNVGGLILGVTATRYPTMTAGTVWGRTNEFEMSTIDYSTPTGTFNTYWFESDGTVHETTGLTQYPITQWNDIDNDQLDTIGNNQYAVWWVFLNVTNNELAFIYPSATYANSASAEAESVPSHIPGDWYLEGFIIGRIIIQQGQDIPVEVQSVFETQFTAALAADHGNLSGLSDDDHTQYYGSGLREPEGTAILSTGETGGSKFLREDGDDSCSWQTVPAPEYASIAETDTGTEDAKAVTPDGLQGSFRNLRFLVFTLYDSEVDVDADTDLIGDYVIPFDCTIIQDDSNKEYFSAAVDTAGTDGTMVVDVNKNGTTIMTTNKLDIETGEKSTTTASTQPDVTTTALSAGDILTFDVDTAHSTTEAKGLKVYIAVRPD